MANKNIVLFGLTGDPVTSAHMEIIQRLSERFDIVIVIPTNVNYYKNYKGHDRAMFSFTERFDSLVEKCKPFKNVEVSDIERDIKDGWRFYDTLLEITLANGRDNNYSIAIGSDSLQTFKTWYQWEQIIKLAKLVVFNRPGYTDGFPDDIEYEYLDMNNDASSTKVRKNLFALMDKFDDKIEEDDFDIWIDDITWGSDYFDDECK